MRHDYITANERLNFKRAKHSWFRKNAELDNFCRSCRNGIKSKEA